jgi:ABC-type phosphate/phosphonate transport system permease subunit
MPDAFLYGLLGCVVGALVALPFWLWAAGNILRGGR